MPFAAHKTELVKAAAIVKKTVAKHARLSRASKRPSV